MITFNKKHTNSLHTQIKLILHVDKIQIRAKFKFEYIFRLQMSTFDFCAVNWSNCDLLKLDIILQHFLLSCF